MSYLNENSVSEALKNDSVPLEQNIEYIGHDILGPIVHRWLLGLHQYISYFDDGDTTFLFCARAGVRIQRLYEEFLKHSKARACEDLKMFWASRISVCKGLFGKVTPRTSQLIAQEYSHEPIGNLISGIFRHHPEILSALDLDREEYRAFGNVFPGWIQGPTPAAEAMRSYFKECGYAFDAYVKSLVGDKKRAVLIDTGWQGTMQSLLSDGFSDIKWRGLYFGQTLSPNSNNISNIIGILFEGGAYNPAKPETAFVRHRHIVETLLEPNAPSIEEIPIGKFEKKAKHLIEQNKNEAVSSDNDALYCGVLRYLRGVGKEASIADIYARHQAAMREMARIIITPSRKEAMAVVCKDRSADFGRKLKVPVLLPAKIDDDSDNRIQRSLWQEGQIALEYDGGFARDLQLRVSGCTNAASYFNHSDASLEEDRTKAPSVAIITRTKNRPLLLKRAAESVEQQTYDNYVWVIVNDGGDEEAVGKVVEGCAVDRRKILLVNNATSQGMEAASNIGIQNSESDLIVIHDDDDSWESNFLMDAVKFLTSRSGTRYGGVVTGTTYVSEEIRGHTVIEHNRQPYMNWVKNIQLAEMAAGNLFAPIAFVYRRQFWTDIGGYNASLPVLGDWFFNLEFLLRTDIGVIPIPLANYHHRDRGGASAYSNSVIGGISKHEEFAAVARNEFIRKNAVQFPAAVAAIFSYFAHDIRKGNIPASPRTIENSSSNVSNNFADKYWAVLHINKRAKLGVLPIGKYAHLEPTIEWMELEDFLRKKRAIIPVPPDFNDEEYIKNNPDVASEIKKGRLRSGYQHYLMHGRREGRLRPHK